MEDTHSVKSEEDNVIAVQPKSRIVKQDPEHSLPIKEETPNTAEDKNSESDEDESQESRLVLIRSICEQLTKICQYVATIYVGCKEDCSEDGCCGQWWHQCCEDGCFNDDSCCNNCCSGDVCDETECCGCEGCCDDGCCCDDDCCDVECFDCCCD